MTKLNKGLYLVLGTALISGVSVFLNKFAVMAISNSDVFTTIKNLVLGLILTGIVLTPFLLDKLKKVAKADWLKLGIIGVIGGSVPFLLFFKGLSLTTATSAAFIHKTLFIWVSLLAIYFLREKIGRLQYLALGLLFLGNFILLGFKFMNFGYGEFLVLIATLMWAIEFVIAKKVLKNVDSEIVAWARMFFGAIILLGYLAATSQINNLITLNLNQMYWVIISSVLLLGYVLTWYKALKYLSAVTVTSILVLASPITTCLEIITSQKFNIYQIGGSLAITLACGFIIYSVRQIKDVQVIAPKFN